MLVSEGSRGPVACIHAQFLFQECLANIAQGDKWGKVCSYNSLPGPSSLHILNLRPLKVSSEVLHSFCDLNLAQVYCVEVIRGSLKMNSLL